MFELRIISQARRPEAGIVTAPETVDLAGRTGNRRASRGMLSGISRFKSINNASQTTVITKTFFLM
jgi:hypothetical protein